MAGNKNSGRKSKKWHKAQAKYAMIECGQQAAGYLKAVMQGKIEPDWKLIDVAKFCLNHELGLPKQRTEVTGADGQPLIPYPELVAIAMQAAQVREGLGVEAQPVIAGLLPEKLPAKEKRALE